MTMVLQIIDLLYIKYESQESIVMYISNHWMETTRERVCLEGGGGCVILCTLQKTNPKKIYGTRKLKPKSDHRIVQQRLERMM